MTKAPGSRSFSRAMAAKEEEDFVMIRLREFMVATVTLLRHVSGSYPLLFQGSSWLANGRKQHSCCGVGGRAHNIYVIFWFGGIRWETLYIGRLAKAPWLCAHGPGE